MITLEHVSKVFGDKQIFKDFDITIFQGEMISILGESGKGKSTLLNMIGLLEKPNAGCVKFEDHDIYALRYNRKEFLRYTVGYMFQNLALIENQSVSDNLDIALYYRKATFKEKLEIKISALEKVGLNNVLKSKVYTLSGGEQQRVAIARLLIKPSKIILADEPTGLLDEKNKKFVLQALDELNKMNKTVVIATHDLTITSKCHRIIQL